MLKLKNSLIFVAIIVFLLSGISLIESKDLYTEGSPSSKKVALTFDDGPGASTIAILDILKSKNVKATFFLLGSHVKKNPNWTKRLVQDGHEIGNHTYNHINFFLYDKENKDDKIENELLSSEKIIKETIGVKTHLARFPNGYSRSDAIQIAKKHGYIVINWAFGCDWNRKMTDDEILAKYKKAIRSGTIFLLHDAPKNAKAVRILSKLIDEIKAKGYEIVTVSELLNLKK
ncbi:MAG: polysaccharide deacetylase family protein [Elusimicrobiota bacterium]|jgi:peptidoglycan/xylan/chitin deacetylase (PgdA/CDA1 family)|nr:polysaccharide deacetylase family protein [Elusimicrobiota bacterium]